MSISFRVFGIDLALLASLCCLANRNIAWLTGLWCLSLYNAPKNRGCSKQVSGLTCVGWIIETHTEIPATDSTSMKGVAECCNGVKLHELALNVSVCASYTACVSITYETWYGMHCSSQCCKKRWCRWYVNTRYDVTTLACTFQFFEQAQSCACDQPIDTCLTSPTIPLRCDSGCTCMSAMLDMNTTSHQSTSQLYSFDVTQAPDCVISISVAAETSSGEHKIKVCKIEFQTSVDGLKEPFNQTKPC